MNLSKTVCAGEQGVIPFRSVSRARVPAPSSQPGGEAGLHGDPTHRGTVATMGCVTKEEWLPAAPLAVWDQRGGWPSGAAANVQQGDGG